MTTTKKDFEAIAEIIYTSHTAGQIAWDLAAYFEAQNPRFDRIRFLEACGRPFVTSQRETCEDGIPRWYQPSPIDHLLRRTS